jgi:hypothetical protein
MSEVETCPKCDRPTAWRTETSKHCIDCLTDVADRIKQAAHDLAARAFLRGVLCGAGFVIAAVTLLVLVYA